MSATPLETQRLVLLPLSAEMIAALGGERATAERLLGARIPAGWPDAELAELLPQYAEWLAADPALLGYGPWIVVRRDEPVVVGSAGFLGRPKEGAVELGYGVHPEHRNRGYAGEAARVLVPWALARHDVERVIATCDAENVASVRVLEKAGLTRVGESDGTLSWQADSPPAG